MAEVKKITDATLKLKGSNSYATHTSLNAGGKEFVLGPDKKWTFTPRPGSTAKEMVLEGDELLNALTSGLEKQSSGMASLAPEAVPELKAVIAELEGHALFDQSAKAKNIAGTYGNVIGLHDAMTGAVSASEEVAKKTAKVAELEAIEVASRGATHAADLKAAQESAALAEAEFAKHKATVSEIVSKGTPHEKAPRKTLDAFKKLLGDKGWKTEQSVLTKAKALSAEIERTTFPKEADKATGVLNKILAKHHGEEVTLEMLQPHVSKKAMMALNEVEGGLDVHAAMSSFAGNVKQAEGELATISSEIARLHDAIAKAEPADVQARLKDLKDYAKEAGEDFFKADHELAGARGAALKGAPKHIKDTLNEAAHGSEFKTMSSKLTSGIGVTEKAIDTGKGGWFTKSAEEIAKVAETKGVAAEKIGMWGRRTTAGKAGIVIAGAGAAYGLYSVIAGTGNKGPGERANAVSQGRENEPAMGRA